jgi:hypothetical protein
LGSEAPAIRALRGTGAVAAKDGLLTNVDLVAKIQHITGLLGLARDEQAGATTFRTLEGNFTISNGFADFSRIFLDSPLMEVSGSGKMRLSPPTLDLRLAATLSQQASAQTAAARAATFFKDSQGRIVVPLKITGSVKNPAVSLDAEELLRKSAGQFFKQGAGNFFERLFRRR